MKEELQAAMDKILSMANGADGGISYIKLRLLLTTLSLQADDDNDPAQAAAKAVIHSVIVFARLIDVANRLPLDAEAD